MEDGYYIETITPMSLMAGLRMEGIVIWRGLKLQGPLYILWMCSDGLYNVTSE